MGASKSKKAARLRGAPLLLARSCISLGVDHCSTACADGGGALQCTKETCLRVFRDSVRASCWQGVGISTIDTYHSNANFDERVGRGTACTGDRYWVHKRGTTETPRLPSYPMLLHKDVFCLSRCLSLCEEAGGDCTRRDYEACVLGHLTVRPRRPRRTRRSTGPTTHGG